MGGCCSGLVEKGQGSTAYKTIMGVNAVIAIFGIIMIIMGTVQLVQAGDDNFFSNEIYGMMILFGLLTFVLVFLACVGAKNPKEYPNYVFCYWCLVSLLILGNSIALYSFNTFVDSLDEAANGANQDGGVSSVIETQFAKNSNDFILSVYTACCTGCVDPVVCGEIIQPGDLTEGEDFCEDNCDLAEICNADALGENENDFLGIGCYITLQEEEIPGFNVGEDSCSVFREFELVGDENIGGCGGGNPQQFLRDSVSFFQDRYLRFAIPWSMFIGLLVIAWVGSLIIILFYAGGGGRK